eukprot:5132860-Amphidinium_carterae.1
MVSKQMAAIELAVLQKTKLFGFSIDLRAAFNSTPRDLPCQVLELKGCDPDLVHLLFGWVRTTSASFILPHRSPPLTFQMARGWAQGLSTSPLGLEMAIAPMIEHLRSIGCLDASREDIYTYAWFDDLQSAQATANDLKKIADVITTYL